MRYGDLSEQLAHLQRSSRRRVRAFPTAWTLAAPTAPGERFPPLGRPATSRDTSFVGCPLVTPAIDYATPGSFTALDGIEAGALGAPGSDPAAICRPVQTLFIQPTDAEALYLAAERYAEKDIRPVAELVGRLLALDPAPLAVPREPEKRVVGTCRHFAVLSCALLRRAGIAARVRCGFATYFQAGQALDHWITEYQLPDTSTGCASTPKSSADR
jgi:hypothetical protein